MENLYDVGTHGFAGNEEELLTLLPGSTVSSGITNVYQELLYRRLVDNETDQRVLPNEVVSWNGLQACFRVNPTFLPSADVFDVDNGILFDLIFHRQHIA